MATYEEYLKNKLNVVERLTDDVTGVDERLDYANMLLTEIRDGLGQTGETPMVEALVNLKSTIEKIFPQALENMPTFYVGNLDVVTAGTAMNLPELPIPDGFEVIICAKRGNTGYIYFANDKISAEGANTRFDRLNAGDSISLRIMDLSEIWIDASVSGEGLSWCVERK